MPKPLIIINPAAAKARRAWPIVNEKLRSARLEFDFYETSKPGDASARTRTALQTGITTMIAVVGGDGTLSEAAEGFFEFNTDLDQLPARINPLASLAVIPAGTGDDFARGLTQGTRSPLEYWIALLVMHCQGKPELSDLDVLYGRCDQFQTPFICLNASTMGIGGETATRVAAQGKFMRSFSGEARFATAAMAALANWRERRVRVTVDDRELIDGAMNLAAVANALFAGGGMMLSPEATNDDGKLDVVTASGLNRAEIVRELTRIHKGGHVANPKVRIMQGTSVRIETFSVRDAMPIEADGNVRGYTPVSFRTMPGALKFVTGR